jgi:hypothetical protein
MPNEELSPHYPLPDSTKITVLNEPGGTDIVITKQVVLSISINRTRLLTEIGSPIPTSVAQSYLLMAIEALRLNQQECAMEKQNDKITFDLQNITEHLLPYLTKNMHGKRGLMIQLS